MCFQSTIVTSNILEKNAVYGGPASDGRTVGGGGGGCHAKFMQLKLNYQRAVSQLPAKSYVDLY